MILNMLIRIKNIVVQGCGAPSDIGQSEGCSSQPSSLTMSVLTRRKTRTSQNRLDTNYVYQTVPVEVSSDPIRPLMAVSAVAAVSEKASAVVSKPDSIVLPIYYTQEGSRGDVLKEALIGRQRLSDVSVIAPITAKVSALVTSLQDGLLGTESVEPSESTRAGLYVCALLVDENVTRNDVKKAVELILDGSVLTPEGLFFSSLTVGGSLRGPDSSKVVLDSIPTGLTTDGNVMNGLIVDNSPSPSVPWYNTQVFYDGLVAAASVVGGVLMLSTGVGLPAGLGLLAVGVNRLIQSVTSSIYDEHVQGSLAVTFSPGRIVSDCIAFASVFVPAMLPISGMAKVAAVAGAMALNRMAVAEDASSFTAAFDPALTLIDDVYQMWRIVPVILIALIAVVVGNRSLSWRPVDKDGHKEQRPHRSAMAHGRLKEGREDPLHRFVIRKL